MNFYIRQTFDSPIEGPFPPATIISKIETGEITLDWLANPDLRESRGEIERSLKRDWMPIRSIAELLPDGIQKRTLPRSNEFDPKRKAFGGCFGFAFVFLGTALIILAIIYEGCRANRF